MSTKSKSPAVVDSVESLLVRMAEIREAQQIFATFSQEQVDHIFKMAALAANKQRIPLAKFAAEETGMGIMEDKVIKNHFASEYTYNKYKNDLTCGVVEEDKMWGIRKIAEPVGLIAAVIPTTNPTSTAIFKSLLALKTRNGVIFAPHPKAKECTAAAAKVILDAAVAAGAPKDIIGWIDMPSLDITNAVMKNADLILATGGPGMVKAAYSSGKPAIGVGNGNTPAIIHSSACIPTAVNSIIVSKTFDNGVICASEQSVIVDEAVYAETKKEFVLRGCHILKNDELDKMRKTLVLDGALNTKIVGQPAEAIAKLAGFDVPKGTKILIGEVESVDINQEPFAREKLSPVLAMYKAKTFNDAIEKADRLIKDGGYGHTSALYVDTTNAKDAMEQFEATVKTGRVLINTPSSHGAIGDLYNFKLAPSMTLGCGSWGGNITSENVGIKQLLNIKTVAERRENMLWFRTPGKIYFKKGGLGVALTELQTEYNSKKVFIVTDQFLYKNDYHKPVTDILDGYGIKYQVFSDVQPDPLLSSAQAGAKAMMDFEPDVIIALGGGSAIDAGKMMWLLYEHPDCDFMDLSMRFMDVRKRVYTFPKMGQKATFIAVATSAGTGSEVTPFTVITDDETGIKYPIADYELMPNMAIVDVDFMMDMPKGLTAASGLDALSHALESYASMFQTDFSAAYSLAAAKNIFDYLPTAYNDGQNVEAREKMAYASTMAGMAFANGLLGICHSMAHKVGMHFHVPHGVANAILIKQTIRFNATDNPAKMGAFSQYPYPVAVKRYAEIARHIGLTGKDDAEMPEKLIAKIDELRNAVGIKATLKDYIADEKAFLAKLDLMAEQAFDDQCTGANPRYPMIAELKELYLNAFYGK